MIGALAIPSGGEEARVVPVSISHPNGRNCAGFSTAIDQLVPAGGFAGPEVPGRRRCGCERGYLSGGWVEATDLSAAICEFRFEVAVEVVGIGSLMLVFPGDFGVGESAREEDLAIVSPSGEAGASATVGEVTVGRPKPHGLSFGQCLEVRAIGARDADVTPVMAGVVPEVTRLKGEPASIGRPTRPEVEVVGMSCDLDTICAINGAGPDLVALRARQMIGNAPAIRAQAEPIGQTFTQSRELAGIRAIQIHAVDLSTCIADDLHEDPFVRDQ